MFDRDIQGRPWQPCPDCPHPTPGACASRRHRAYCRIARDHPARVAALPAEHRPPRLTAPEPVLAPLVIRGHVNGFTGYGQATTQLGAALRWHVPDLAFEPFGEISEAFGLEVPLWVWGRTFTATAGPVLQIANPHVPPIADRRTVTLSMWESSRIPFPHVAALNQAERVLVPCAWNAEVFRASGVTVPVHVVPLGIDTEVYTPRQTPRTPGPLVFGCAGRIQHGGTRKGLQDVVSAFLRAFPRGADVRLRVKCWPDDPPLATGNDPRVEIEREPLTAEQLADWYRSLDVFVSASRAEGFGLQPLQAMACGVPVLAGWHTGHAEYLDASCAWELPCRPEPAEGVYAGLGEWYVADPDGMVDRLQSIAADPAAIRAKVARAAIVAAGWTWDRAADAIHRHLAEAFAWDRPTTGPTLGVCGHVDRLDTLPEAIDLLRPHVDRIAFLVDDRADASVGRWLANQGITWRPYRWVDDYAAAGNAAADLVGTDWILQIDADEVLQGAEWLRDAIDHATDTGHDVVQFARRHWLDRARTQSRDDGGWWPDWQSRLRRRGVRLRWRVHSELDCDPGRILQWDHHEVWLDHFNLALRSESDWDRVNAGYARLLLADQADGRVLAPELAAAAQSAPRQPRRIDPPPELPPCPERGPRVASGCGCRYECRLHGVVKATTTCAPCLAGEIDW